MTFKERAEYIALAERDMEFRKKFLALCKNDPVFFANTCLWTFDPRLEAEKRFLPFLLFPQQEEFMRGFAECIKEGQDGLCDKSRDTGASWCTLAVVFHHWYFQQAFTCLLGSRKEDFVDKSNEPACLMWKLDEMYRSLPKWMQIPGYVNSKPTRTHLMMHNPVTQSTIAGESANPNFGRAGRYSVVLMDEAAFWANLRAAYTSAGESSRCRFLVSTPNGMNMFGKLANPPKKKKGEKQAGPRKFRLHWSQDPRHNKMEVDTDPESTSYGMNINPWYEKQRLRYAYDVEQMAQELEIDYKSSVKGRYYPQVDLSGLEKFEYDPNLPLYSAWDFGTTDDTAILWVQFDARRLRYRIIDAYANRGKSIAFFIPFITGLPPGDTEGETYTRQDLEIIERHRGWRHTAHFGDPAGNSTTQTTNTSVIDELYRERIYIICNSKENTYQSRRDATKRLLMRTSFEEDLCEDLIDAIRNSKYPERGDGNQATAPNSKPVHDQYSHYRSALEYFAVNDPHRWDTQETSRGIDWKSRTVGAVFGRQVGASHVDEDYSTDGGYDDEDSFGVSQAGY